MKNIQTGNCITLTYDEDRMPVEYVEIAPNFVINAYLAEDTYEACAIRDDFVIGYTLGHACIDDALASLYDEYSHVLNGWYSPQLLNA